MKKYYTRACNFYYGKSSKKLVKQRKALPLCGNKNISFDTIEIYTRQKNRQITSETIKIKDIKKLKYQKKRKIILDLKKISLKRKNFLEKINFLEPSIMGILNMTPDSFSDGGMYNTKKKSKDHIKNMIKNGANIIYIGGESTRPGSKEVKIADEWKRLEKVIINFKKNFKNILLSIDSRKSEIIEKSSAFGVDIINDVSGFSYDKKTLSLVKSLDKSNIIHHMQGTPNTMQKNPKYFNVLLDIYDFFEKKIEEIKENQKIIIDPGIGFGKKLKHNLILISNISLYHSLGYPILIGTSRKKFIGQLANKYDSRERIGGTLASVLYLLSQGVQIFRVHNVKEVKQGITVFKEILSNNEK